MTNDYIMAENPQKLGQYTLLDKIAQGGMAQVFKAKTVDSNGFERLVVIKRILPHISADPEYVEMLVDEAKIAVNFTHGNIAQIIDLGRVKNDYFIVMEYVDGKTFSQINKRLKNLNRKIPLDILLYCAIETCHGLSYIHNKKGADGKSLDVVHRDISPQNVILTYSGHIKIIDFGVAKATVKEGKTESGVLKGKFAYMSPEQARSDAVDYRSDIFSMGIVLWEMATGKRLFKRRTNHETVKAIQKTKFDAASSMRIDLDKKFDKIIKKALKKNPKQRYHDARDMALDLEKLLFQINPNFKPVYAAEFIYKLFGPEDDEKELPEHIFEKEITPVTNILQHENDITQKNQISREEPTIKDLSDNATPIVKLSPLKEMTSQYLWVLAFIVFLFISGTIYVYITNKAEKASLFLNGYDQNMSIAINGEEIMEAGPHIILKSEKNYELTITKKGYEDFYAKFYLNPYEEKTINIKLNKIVPKVSNVIISTNPSGATIYINNKEWPEKTPVILKHLEVGKIYHIGLFLDGYKFYLMDVSPREGEDLNQNYDFIPKNDP